MFARKLCGTTVVLMSMLPESLLLEEDIYSIESGSVGVLFEVKA